MTVDYKNKRFSAGIRMLTFKIPSGVHPIDQKKKTRRYHNAIKKATYGTRTHTLNCEEKISVDKKCFLFYQVFCKELT